MAKRFCEDCGTELTEGKEFCGECGAAVSSEEVSQGVTESAEQDGFASEPDIASAKRRVAPAKVIKIVVIAAFAVLVLTYFFGPKEYIIGEWECVGIVSIDELRYIGDLEQTVGIYYTRYDGVEEQAQYNMAWPNPTIVESEPTEEEMRVVTSVAPVYRRFLGMRLVAGEATRVVVHIVNYGAGGHPEIVPLKEPVG